MEVKSEPKFEEVTYTEIIVSYPGGNVPFTLKEAADTTYRAVELTAGQDSYSLPMTREDNLTITFGSGEVVRLEAHNRNWYSVREYTLKRPIKESKEQA